MRNGRGSPLPPARAGTRDRQRIRAACGRRRAGSHRSRRRSPSVPSLPPGSSAGQRPPQGRPRWRKARPGVAASRPLGCRRRWVETGRVRVAMPSPNGLRLLAHVAPAQPLDPPSVHAKVVQAGARGGADVDDPLVGAEAKLDIVDEAAKAAAERVEVVCRLGNDFRAREILQKRSQPADHCLRVSQDDEGLDAMNAGRVASAADAVPPAPTRSKRFAHRTIMEKS